MAGTEKGVSGYTRETCPDRRKHTVCPARYLEWHAWADWKAKTHRQVACPTCGLYVIWKRKTARAKPRTSGAKHTTGDDS